MGQPLTFDKSNTNYLQRCYYVINLMKAKDYEIWETFYGQYCSTRPEESWELFQMAVDEYRKLCAPAKVQRLKAKKPAARKTAAKRAA